MSVWSDKIDPTKQYIDLRTMEKTSGEWVKKLLEISDGNREMEGWILMTFVKEDVMHPNYQALAARPLESLNLTEHAQMWHYEETREWIDANSPEFKPMYEKWVEFAFSDMRS